MSVRTVSPALSANTPFAQPFLPGMGRAAGKRMADARLAAARKRLTFLALGFGVAFLAVALRLLDASLMSGVDEPRFARAASSQAIAVARADITDRNGTLLATLLPSHSLYADPARVMDAAQVARQLGGILPEVDVRALEKNLTRAKGRFLWVARHLRPEQVEAVNALGLPGLYFTEEDARVYPTGDLFSSVLGYTDVDHSGLAGIERGLDSLLRRKETALALSVDARIQNIFTQALLRAQEKFRAIGSAGLLMDIHTGEILALVSLPSFDPHAPQRANDDARFNRVTQGVYELGSTFKLFTVATALHARAIHLSDILPTTLPLKRGRFTIRDYKPKDHDLSVPEVFLHSSNIGTALMAEKVGLERQRAFLQALGLFARIPLEGAENATPLVPKHWSAIQGLTISYGHGIAVTPLHLVTATAYLLNGGVAVQPTYRKVSARTVSAGAAPPDTATLVDGATAATLRGLMRLVVTQGTGRFADVPGYQIGGKTGTSEKQVNGRYVEDKRLSSFVGAFPMSNPRYVIFAMLDEPKPAKDTHGYATGGWTAAPVVAEVVRAAAPLLGLMPGDDAAADAALLAEFDGLVRDDE